MADSDTRGRPNLAEGLPASALRPGGMVLGRVGDEDVLLARSGDEFFAVGAHCTHYHGALVEGLVVGDTVRCPLHHACFSLRSGEALRAPALDPIACWRVERRGQTVIVRERRSERPPIWRGIGRLSPTSLVHRDRRRWRGGLRGHRHAQARRLRGAHRSDQCR